MIGGQRRDEVAKVLEVVGRDGLPQPHDLDVAIDAIGQALMDEDNIGGMIAKVTDEDGNVFYAEYHSAEDIHYAFGTNVSIRTGYFVPADPE